MSGYIGTQPVPQATQTRQTFVATAAQTSFATGGYSVGYLDVFLNGVKLQDGVDYTATNGSDIVLTVGAAAGDTLEVVAYTAFEVADVYTKAQADSEFVSDPNGVVTVDGIGNVGIGTTPTGSLDVARSGSHEVVFRTTTTGDPTINLQADGTNNGKISYVRATEGLTFSNGGATRMLIDSSGNVGIGTASPDSLQTLQDDSNTLGPILTFKNQYRSGTTTADYMGGIAFSAWRDISPAKSYVAGIYALGGGYPGSVGNLVFTTGINGGTDPYNAGIERMRIDASGRVTMPYQPAFKAGMNAGTFATGGGSSQIIYDISHFDRGGHYNTSTGRYTVPVTGLYEFTHNISARATYSGAFEVKLFQNGVEKHRQFTFGGGFGHGATATAILLCSQGDYIDARGYWASGITLSGDLDASTSSGITTLSYFSGYLIG